MERYTPGGIIKKSLWGFSALQNRNKPSWGRSFWIAIEGVVGGGGIYVFGVRGLCWADGATAQLEVVFFGGFDGVGNFLCFWGFWCEGLVVGRWCNGLFLQRFLMFCKK